MSAKQFAELMITLGCCLLGICCPPGSPAQRAAWRKLAAAHGLDEAQADEMFDAAVVQAADR